MSFTKLLKNLEDELINIEKVGSSEEIICKRAIYKSLLATITYSAKQVYMIVFFQKSGIKPKQKTRTKLLKYLLLDNLCSNLEELDHINNFELYNLSENLQSQILNSLLETLLEILSFPTSSELLAPFIKDDLFKIHDYISYLPKKKSGIIAEKQEFEKIFGKLKREFCAKEPNTPDSTFVAQWIKTLAYPTPLQLNFELIKLINQMILSICLEINSEKTCNLLDSFVTKVTLTDGTLKLIFGILIEAASVHIPKAHPAEKDHLYWLSNMGYYSICFNKLLKYFQQDHNSYPITEMLGYKPILTASKFPIARFTKRLCAFDTDSPLDLKSITIMYNGVNYSCFTAKHMHTQKIVDLLMIRGQQLNGLSWQDRLNKVREILPGLEEAWQIIDVEPIYSQDLLNFSTKLRYVFTCGIGYATRFKFQNKNKTVVVKTKRSASFSLDSDDDGPEPKSSKLF